MSKTSTLPPVRCPECNVMMILTPGNKVVCPASLAHRGLWPLPEKEKRAEWRAEQRKVALKLEVTRLPEAIRSIYREARPGAPGGYFYRIKDKLGITGKLGLWQQGSGEGEVEVNYGGKKRTVRPVPAKVEQELRELLKALAEPKEEKAPDDAAAPTQ